MALGLRRRSFLQGLFVASASAWAFGGAGCEPGDSTGGGGEGGGTTSGAAPVVARKSASALDAAEIDRFVRAFEYAVAKGHFDAFNDTHHDHHHQRHHGADVLATSPMTVAIMPTNWGYRLLPWHRSFLLEVEKMLRAALRARNEEEGKSPAEADLLFVPYWDAAHDQGLPDWVLAFQPKGGTAPVPEGLPEGHAGYGKAVGARYDIELGRWPGENPVFDTLNTPDHVGRILANEDFVGFYDALDTNPEVVTVNFPKAKSALSFLGDALPDSEAVATVQAGLSTPPSDAESQVAFTNALLELGWLAAVEERKASPDAAIIVAVKDVYSMFNFMPHLRMHLWAGGLHPENADLRGTVTYFNELTVDPVFWMLHAEIDRLWYTWEESHDGTPPLEPADSSFTPMSVEPAKWYGGGQTYSLEELTDHASLPYTYDRLFEV